MNKMFKIKFLILLTLAASFLTVYAQSANTETVDFMQNGEKIMALTDGDVVVNVEVSSPAGGEGIIAFAAVYNNLGLLDLDITTKALTQGLNVLEPLLLKNVSGQSTVKVYVWYMDSLKPLCEPVVLTSDRKSAARFYLNKFDSLMNRENLLATAKLYDAESGGYYFTGSSRDYEPFEAHIESTAQMVDYMYIAGVLDKMPVDIKNKLVKFFQERQSSDDGYFYDMRDGNFITDIRPSKKGRDYDKAVAALKRLGAEPLYPRGGNGANAALASALLTANSDTKYDSAENFAAYVTALFDNNPKNMYYVGNELVSTYSQYKDLPGYADIARGIAEERQNQTTGLWGDGKNYDALNAAMKLSGIFDKTYPFPQFEKALFSVIDIAKTDTAPTASSIWNIIDFINTAKNTYTDSDVRDIADNAIDKNLGDLTKIILKRVDQLKQPDGLYSYIEDGVGTTTQGWINSLGLKEGSINANMLCTAYMYEQAYWLYGLRTEKPLANYADEYFELLKSAPTVVKKYYTADVYNENFENEESIFKLNGAVLTADPKNSGNICLGLTGTTYRNPSITFREAAVLDKAVMTQRIYLKNNDDNNYGTFEFVWGEGEYQTGLHLKIKRQDKTSSKLCLTTNGNSSGGDIELCTLSLNQWHDVKLEYSPYDSTSLRIYVDRQIVYFGAYSYLNRGKDIAEILKTFRQLVISKHSNSTTDLFIDDISFGVSNAPRVYALHFEDENEVSVQGLREYSSTSSVTEDTQLAGNKYLEINNPSGGEQYGLGFDAVSDFSKVILNQRVYIKRGTTSAGTYYMQLGKSDSTTALLLRFDVWYKGQSVSDVKIMVVGNNGEEEVSAHIPNNKWCDLSVEYSPDSENGKVKVYVNGVLGYEGNMCDTSVTALRQNVFKKDGSSDGYLYLDDMEMILIP